jgi:hypothetical protein
MGTKSRRSHYSKPGGTSGEGEPMGEKTLTITVGLPERSLCGNGTGRANGFMRARLVKPQREAAKQEARDRLWRIGYCGPGETMPCYFPTGRVRVDVLVKRDPLWSARRLDDDNLIRGLKATMDGFADAGVWVDDRQVQWGTIEWESADPLRGEIVLTLTEEVG